MPRMEEILIWAGLNVPAGGHLPPDHHIVTTCPTCAEEQTLAEADFFEGEEESAYMCRNQCQPILIIGAPGLIPWPGRGYRIQNFTLRNPADLYLWLLNQQGRRLPNPVLFPASPAALADAKRRTSQTDPGADLSHTLRYIFWYRL
jgi:hypothetical protein